MNKSEQVIRNKIVQILRETRDIELSQYGPLSTVRFYKMTTSEYDMARSQQYTFSVFFGDLPTRNNKTEGYCYDIRTLITKKYIVLNQSTYQLPIPLSKDRWNIIVQKYGDPASLGLTNKVGKLLFPLAKNQLSPILKNIRNEPIICATLDGCISATLEQLEANIGLIKLSDPDPIQRFGKVDKILDPSEIKISGDVVSQPVVVVQPAPPQKKIKEEEIDQIIRMVESDLKYLDVDNQDIYNRLKSVDVRRYILELAERNYPQAFIISTLLSDSIDRVLSLSA